MPKAIFSMALLAVIFVIAFSFVLPQAEPFMAVLAAGMVFLGIPHGALDIFILQKITTNRLGLGRAVALYVLALSPMVALWIFFPEAAFLFFAVFSAVHFAHSDLSEGMLSGHLRTRSRIEFFARFLIPICIPLAFKTERSLNLIQQIYTTHSILQLLPFFRGAAILAMVLSAVLAIMETFDYLFWRTEWRVVAIEPVVLCFLFAVLDPLYAFGIYFSFMHAVKHMVNFFNSDISINLYEVLPYWLLPVFAVSLFVWYGEGRSPDLSSSLFRWSIIVVSAIALPHAFLISWCKYRGIVRT